MYVYVAKIISGEERGRRGRRGEEGTRRVEVACEGELTYPPHSFRCFGVGLREGLLDHRKNKMQKEEVP